MTAAAIPPGVAAFCSKVPEKCLLGAGRAFGRPKRVLRLLVHCCRPYWAIRKPATSAPVMRPAPRNTVGFT
jgi:hypothetical protein